MTIVIPDISVSVESDAHSESTPASQGGHRQLVLNTTAANAPANGTSLGPVPPTPGPRKAMESIIALESFRLRHSARASSRRRIPIPKAPAQSVGENGDANTAIEDEMNLEQLRTLMRMFEEADAQGTGELSMEEFKEAFRQVFGGKDNDEQMTMLFMKIDANSDGTIDWDEFCTYMLLEYQEKNEMNTREVDPFEPMPSVAEVPHHESIQRILFNPVDRRYITASKDGYLCWWDMYMNLYKSIKLDDAWITDCVAMPDISKICLALGNRELSFYDVKSSDVQLRITHMDHAPLCIHYAQANKKLEHRTLIFGDDNGYVNVISLLHTEGLFRSAAKKNRVPELRFDKLLSSAYESVRLFRYRLHSDWVLEARYLPTIHCFVSCSKDERASTVVFDMDRLRVRSTFKVKKGVNSFDYSPEGNVIATGGQDRAIRLFNPYVLKPAAVMRGHEGTVVKVVVNDNSRHLITLSHEKVIKIWDIRDQICLQTIHGQPYTSHSDEFNSIIHNPFTNAIVVASHQISSWRLRPRESTNEMPKSHAKPICAALYNENFKQVVSGCHGSACCIWDIETGQKVFRFTELHGHSEITAMAFDAFGRRLLTGARDGSLKMWNFNNGQCLKELVRGSESEVSDIVHIEKGRQIITVGWDKRVVVFEDATDTYSMRPSSIWEGGGHTEDILCMSVAAPHFVATGSYDGAVLLWNTVSGHMLNRLVAPTLAERSRDDRAIEKLLFLKHRMRSAQLRTVGGTLVACGAGGMVYFWNVMQGVLVGSFCASHVKGDPVVAMVSDGENRNLWTGDTKGYITCFNISNYAVSMDEHAAAPPLLRSWRCHAMSISSIDIAPSYGVLITSSVDRTVRLWTLTGQYVGTFGQSMPWRLGLPSTYRTSLPADLEREPSASGRARQAASSPESKSRQGSASGADREDSGGSGDENAAAAVPPRSQPQQQQQHQASEASKEQKSVGPTISISEPDAASGMQSLSLQPTQGAPHANARPISARSQSSKRRSEVRGVFAAVVGLVAQSGPSGQPQGAGTGDVAVQQSMRPPVLNLNLSFALDTSLTPLTRDREEPPPDITDDSEYRDFESVLHNKRTSYERKYCDERVRKPLMSTHFAMQFKTNDGTAPAAPVVDRAFAGLKEGTIVYHSLRCCELEDVALPPLPVAGTGLLSSLLGQQQLQQQQPSAAAPPTIVQPPPQSRGGRSMLASTSVANTQGTSQLGAPSTGLGAPSVVFPPISSGIGMASASVAATGNRTASSAARVRKPGFRWNEKNLFPNLITIPLDRGNLGN